MIADLFSSSPMLCRTNIEFQQRHTVLKPAPPAACRLLNMENQTNWGSMGKYGQHDNIFPLFIALHTIHLDNSWSKLLQPWLSWLWWPIRHDEPRAALVTPKHCDSPHANRPAFQNTTPILRAGFFLMTITSKNKTGKICKMHYIKCCRWPIWVFCFSLPQNKILHFETLRLPQLIILKLAPVGLPPPCLWHWQVPCAARHVGEPQF